MRRRLAVLAALVALAPGLVACSDDDPSADATTGSAPTPRGVTADEADRLAAARLRTYQRELVSFEASVPVEAGTVTMHGRADMREHRAVAAAVSESSDAEPPAYAIFAWNLAAAGFVQSEVEVTDAELDRADQIPTRSWGVHPLEGSSEPLDQVLLVLLNLAADRPENSQLLRQNGAQWRGETVVGGREVDIMAATPPESGGTLTYYVADDGTLVRVDVALGSSVPGTITFQEDDAAAVGEVPVVKALGATPDLEPSPEAG
jgi:hypothetical protein